MFTSNFTLDTIIPRIQSKHAQIGRSTIALSFLNTNNAPRKSSFLPTAYVEQSHTHEDDTAKYYNLGTSVFTPPKDRGQALVKRFCTGSKYYGECNELGMAGKGIYKFPHGVIYDGYFNRNGEFHGSGALIYPCGQKVEGLWRNGKLMKGASCTTADDIPFASHYCKDPDRRFQIEVQNELAAATQEYLTNRPNPPKEIPAGCYDTGDGFYDPDKRIIFDYLDQSKTKTLTEFGNFDDEGTKETYEKILEQTKSQENLLAKLRQKKALEGPSKVISIPLDVKERWIYNNCRKAWDEPVGYREELYETWTSGTQSSSSMLYREEEFRTPDDDFIRSISMLTPDAETASTLYSFIITSGVTSQKGHHDEAAYLRRKSGSLLALSRMLLPKATEQDELKDVVVKKAHIYHAKNKTPSRSPKPSRYKSSKIKHHLGYKHDLVHSRDE